MINDIIILAIIAVLWILQLLLYLVKKQSKNDLQSMPNMKESTKEAYAKVIESTESVSFWILVLVILLVFYIIVF